MAVTRICEDARFDAKLTKSTIPGEPYYPKRIIYYFCTHLRLNFTPNFCVDISDTIDQKIESVKCYASQFVGASAAVPEQVRAVSAYFGTRIGTAHADTKPKPAQLPATRPGAHTTFASLKQIDAGVLNVGYAEAGPTDGPVVILLHGWPYDIYSYVDVAPLLASAGYRVIVPYLRGYGTTHFLSSETPRNGQPSAMATDIIALMDALKIQKATVAGYDWGARTADILAALWPERCKALVSVSGADRRPGSRQDAVAAGGRTAMVVPVLFRHRARPARL
jgi:hypothetical protein